MSDNSNGGDNSLFSFLDQQGARPAAVGGAIGGGIAGIVAGIIIGLFLCCCMRFAAGNED